MKGCEEEAKLGGGQSWLGLGEGRTGREVCFAEAVLFFGKEGVQLGHALGDVSLAPWGWQVCPGYYVLLLGLTLKDTTIKHTCTSQNSILDPAFQKFLCLLTLAITIFT